MEETIRVGVGVEEEIREAALAAFREQTGIAVERGDPATSDLLLLDELAVVDRIRAGSLEMLGRRAHRAKIDLDDFPQAAIDHFRASDMVYAIPYRAHSLVLIYRADLMASYDFTVPVSWEELTATAAAARERPRANGHEEFAGFVGSAIAGYDEVYRLLGSALFPAWGWRWNRGSGQPPRVYAPAAVAALSHYAALLREAGPVDAPALTTVTARARFAAGRAMFLIDDTRAFFAARRTLGAEAVGIAMVPAGPSGRAEPGLFAPALCIPVGSEQRDTAWGLLRFLISPEQLLADAVAGEDPDTPRESVFAASGFASAFDARTREVLRATRAHARINRPVIPFARELGGITGEAARSVIAGERTAAEALSTAQATIDGLHWSDERPRNLGRAG